MQVVAVPVKSLARSKSRLAGLLSRQERAALTLALANDVLDACLAVEGWEVWVVSPDPAVLGLASSRGAHPFFESNPSLLAAVRQVEAAVISPGAELAVVLGDLPWLKAGELRRALRTEGPVVAAPAASDGGTNLLLRRPPAAIPARFGPASFAKHLWHARRRGLPLVEVRSPGLEHDLDRPSDLVRVLSTAGGRHTRAACLDMGLADRLLAPADRR